MEWVTDKKRVFFFQATQKGNKLEVFYFWNSSVLHLQTVDIFKGKILGSFDMCV